MDGSNSDLIRKNLAKFFAGYRAEWLNEHIFQLFTQPSYFPQLLTPNPCFLVGGRGSGKTTVLRWLSYEGQEAAKNAAAVFRPPVWEHIGIYYRVNTNRVAAFDGPERDLKSWSRLFGHYLNLELCDKVFKFLRWRHTNFPGESTLGTDALTKFGLSLGLSGCTSLAETVEALERSRLAFEASINSIGDNPSIGTISLQGAPLDQLMAALRDLPQFSGKLFFFLIDEYENFLDYQQQVCNTLIKHCGEFYSFKIGVRELGLRRRTTLNSHEQLVHPADYKQIDISSELEHDSKFEMFAQEIFAQRLKTALSGVVPDREIPDIAQVFTEISVEEEAVLLGVQSEASRIRASLDPAAIEEAKAWFSRLRDFETFVLWCRAAAEKVTLEEKVLDSWKNQSAWSTQYENYKVSYLFLIRKGKAGIRKYYSGWRTYCALASANIRYLMELVDKALTLQLESGALPLSPISPKMQTEAASATGQKNLRELEGLSIVHGAKLIRLLLGLGRIFQVMAEDSLGHTPEANQFNLAVDEKDSPETEKQVGDILDSAVMNLALLRLRGSKLQGISDVRDYDFCVHPIFAPFFGFSHRRKRKIPLAQGELLGLLGKDTGSFVKKILSRQNRDSNLSLPEQLALFEGLYAL